MKIFIVLLLTGVVLGNPRLKKEAEANRTWWENLNIKLPDVELDTTNIGFEDRPRFGTTVSEPIIIFESNSSDGNSSFNSHSGTNSSFGTGNSTDLISTRIAGCGGRGTVCVPYYQCEDGKVITDGAGLIDIRLGETVIATHSNCPRHLDVCCQEPYSTIPKPPYPTPHTPGCGHRNIEGVHARINGFNVTQTQFGEYPWMVAILRVEYIGGEEVNLYLCGGSLIQPNVVLTAAHCIKMYGVDSLKVRAGEWDTQSEYEILPHQDSLVSNVKIHPDFIEANLWNDFAVLILKTPFILGPNIDTICLPSHGETFDHVSCFATGWGKDKFGREGRFQNILKQVALKIVPHNICENALRSTRLGEYFKLDSSFLCAGGREGIDTCKGDGGSPLVCARPKNGFKAPTYYQVGIVAWGIGCGEDGIPGVYADVTKGVDWIYKAFTPYLIV